VSRPPSHRSIAGHFSPEYLARSSSCVVAVSPDEDPPAYLELREVSPANFRAFGRPVAGDVRPRLEPDISGSTATAPVRPAPQTIGGQLPVAKRTLRARPCAGRRLAPIRGLGKDRHDVLTVIQFLRPVPFFF